MHEWLSGRALPCQGGGREFKSRLVLNNIKNPDSFVWIFYISLLLFEQRALQLLKVYLQYQLP